MVVTVGGDGAGDDNGIPILPIMMPATMVVERNRSVVTVMKPLTFLVDDPDLVVMSMMGRDDNVRLSGRSQSGQSHRKRQSAHDHCFHCNFSIALISPSLDTTAADPFGSGFPGTGGDVRQVEGRLWRR